jgi:bis(5'-nucleosyl)-tetraphosphatase (symmetrical)
MATYAIGDVHGCFATLERLFARLGYSPRQDRLWLVGDLVNRGPSSLAVLRWAAGQDEDRVVAVLGNHDLHLLARAAGLARERRRDTLEEVLAAPDRDDLLVWLSRRPLLHREDGHALVHAGLLPEWTVGEAEALARQVEGELRGTRADRLLGTLRDELPSWRDDLPGAARRRLALAAFTRLRTLVPGKGLCTDFSGPPEQAPDGCLPWFEVPKRKSRGTTLLFGHWAALGYLRKDGIVALDTGCVWGRTLTALRLDDGKVFQVRAAEPTTR